MTQNENFKRNKNNQFHRKLDNTLDCIIPSGDRDDYFLVIRDPPQSK